MIPWNLRWSSFHGGKCKEFELSLMSSPYWSLYYQHSKWTCKLLCSWTSDGGSRSLPTQWVENNGREIITCSLSKKTAEVEFNWYWGLGFLTKCTKMKQLQGKSTVYSVSHRKCYTARPPFQTLHHVIIFTFPFVTGIMKWKLSIRHIFLTR